MKQYEVVVIGAGPGGYQAALELGREGLKTLLIDRSKEHIGGTCLNEGCIPAKSYLQSASFVSKISYFESCGVLLNYKGLNLKQLKEKTLSLKNEIRSGVLWMLEQAKVDIIYGNASFTDEKTVKVNGENISFKRCVVSTGSSVRELPQLAIDSKFILSSSDIFKLSTLPKSIAIIGMGPIGCEFATFFSSFGVEVSLIGRSSQLLPKEDEDISKALSRAFKKANIKLLTSTTVFKVEVSEEGIKLFINESKEIIQCELVLSATGRVSNIEELKLENAGIELTEQGFIKISPSFETSQKHIYAIGDCINTPAYAHTAHAEAKVSAHNIITLESKSNTHITPSTIFTNPQVASCGLSEKDAKEEGREIEVKKAFFKVNAKAKIEGDDAGFAKVIVCAKSGVVLGASVIGVEATEIIHEFVLSIEKKLTIMELREIIHAHPTISEIISYL